MMQHYEGRLECTRYGLMYLEWFGNKVLKHSLGLWHALKGNVGILQAFLLGSPVQDLHHVSLQGAPA